VKAERFEWLYCFKAILDQKPFPAFVVSSDRVVRLVNAKAHAPRLPAFIRVEEGRGLHLDNPAALNAFVLLMRGLLCARSGDIGPRILNVEAAEGSELTFALTLLTGPPPGGSDSALFVVSVRRKLCAVEVETRHLMGTFGFTKAEANLCAALANGLSLQEYAERERIKVSTARWHLQNAFERCGARSQSELIGMIVSVFG
jgi:DNA-binding CsgD family transcriptional regulator